MNPRAIGWWLFATSLGTLIGALLGDALIGGSAGLALATGWSLL